ncbi:MAG TPA: efflux RND transporter periplasmic adaptor subunit [Steroidobacteraceae bacterium]|jgi:RND family efflux transporter MFP subunit|nr:efflux RND transporter periplasmic adaptor subunit [Steroidobacteraceae bacterium]
MDDRAELLERLRIDRGEGPATSITGRNWKWPIGIGIAILLLLAAGAGVWYFTSTADAVPIKTAVATAVQSTQSGPAAGRTLLDASGYVVALRQASVSANSIYKVNELLVQAGDVVKKNQILARLDDSKTLAALEESQAQVKQLTAVLEAAKIQAADLRPSLVRNQAQLKEGLVSQDAFDAIKTSDDAAEQAVAVAEQNLAVAKATVVLNQQYQDDTIIRSPFDGVVTIKSAQPGEIVSPQFSGGGGVAKIVDMDSLEVDVDVSENFISRVHPKQPALITLNAYPDWHIPAEVIAIVPTADRSKATVEVRVAFKQKDARVLPEMGARVSFQEDAAPATSSAPTLISTAVVVPAEAVQTEGDSGSVYVVDGHTVQHRSVQLGLKDSSGQTILSGLDAGTTVAIGDFTKLKDGVRIKITQ